jgi:hypothetical protein
VNYLVGLQDDRRSVHASQSVQEGAAAASYPSDMPTLALGERCALDLQLSIDGVTRAPSVTRRYVVSVMALHDYRAKLAYRRGIWRERLLVLEVRTQSGVAQGLFSILCTR